MVEDKKKMSGMSKAVYEGWMVRYGRRKIGRSYIHMRYFVLETRVLAFYKKKPQDNMVPVKTIHIDGNCRVEDRGLKTHQGHTVYVLRIYNKKKHHGITMAAFNIQEALTWKEKIELVIDQQQDPTTVNENKAYVSFPYKTGEDSGRNASSSDHDSQCSPEEDDEVRPTLLRRTTIGNGPPESVLDWTHEPDLGLTIQNDQVFSRKHWRLVRCQNGLRIFEELVEVDYLPRSCSRAMKAVGVVEASCESVFQLVMSMDGKRYEWDCSFQYGSLVEEVDGHTAILYHRLQLDWFPMLVWPRDFCYVRYWRRNDDGSYVVLFQSREHVNCGPQPGFVRAHIESGGFKISPLKDRHGRHRSQVQHLMQLDLKGWGVSYIPSFQQHCLLHMLSSVAGLREWFSQTDESTVSRIPIMVNMTPQPLPSKKGRKPQESFANSNPSMDQMHAANRHSSMLDEESDEDEEHHISETEHEAYSAKFENGIKETDENMESGSTTMVNMTLQPFPSKKGMRMQESSTQSNLSMVGIHAISRRSTSREKSDEDEENQIPETEQEVYPMKLGKGNRKRVLEEELSDEIDLSGFSGNLRRDDLDKSRDCWRLSDGNNFRVRSKHFLYDKSKIPAGTHIMKLVAVDWFRDVKRIDHVARRKGCAAQVASEKGLFSFIVNVQVPGATHYSMIFYFISKPLVPGSLLQRFVDGDDEFRNSRFKLIPSVPKGSWIVRQSVGSTPCLLGKAVDCTYIRGPSYLEIDVDIGSSTVANGVLGLVCGVITTLVVDMAFLVQANNFDELPERLLGAVRVSHVELSSAVVPDFETFV